MLESDRNLVSIVEKSNKIVDAFSNIKGLREFLNLLEKYKNVNKEVDEELQKRKKTLTDLERAERALNKARAEDAVEVQKLRVQTQELNRANKDNAREALGLVSVYQKFAQEVRDAKNRAKELGAEMILLENKYRNGEITTRRYNTELKRLSREYTEARIKASGLDQQIKKLDASVGDHTRKVGNYENAIKGISSAFRNAIAAFGVVSAIDLFADIARKGYETIKVLNAQNMALKQVFETEAQISYQKQFLSELTTKYGLDLVSTTEAYTKYSAAVKGTYLEGERARVIFESFAGASAKLGLSADQNAGIFRALEQMISKGKIQAEELRGQLGDRMAGAFQLFAAGMGVSTAQLDAMLKKGTVVADDVLPKVAERLNDVYNLETAGNMDTLAAAQNRLSNEWAFFLDEIASDKESVDFFAGGIDVLTEVVRFLMNTLVTEGAAARETLDALISLIGALMDVLASLTGQADTTSTGLEKFSATLTYISADVNLLAGAINYLAATVSNFFSTMFEDDGWDKFNKKMEESADNFIRKYEKWDKLTSDADKKWEGLGEGDIWMMNEEKRTAKYTKAWNDAKEAKRAYFQFDGKYFSTNTGRNTGKSLDEYIDRGDNLVKKDVHTKTVISDDKAAKKAEKEAERMRKKAEREAEKARKIAFENAKAEIEAKKASLDFIEKSTGLEKKTAEEKEVFFKTLQDQRLKLLQEEFAVNLKYAKSESEREKLRQKNKLDTFNVEKEYLSKIKDAQLESVANSENQYKLSNKSILDKSVELSDQLVEIEKNRINKILDFELEALAKKFELNELEVRNKLQAGEKLTKAEIEFLEKINEARKNSSKEVLDLEKKNLDLKQTLKKLDVEKEEILIQKSNENDLSAQLDLLQLKRNADVEYLTEKARLYPENATEIAKEIENITLEYQQKEADTRKDYFDQAIDSQSEFVERTAAIKETESAFMMLKNAESAEDYAKGIGMMAGSLKAFAKEGSATWKAMATLQATLNMFVGISQALATEKNMWTMIARIALVTVTGIMAISKIQSTPVPKYAEGTLYAEQSGIAITDEEGPELHYSKDWKLKDKGSSNGPRLKQVMQGDKIIPADMSKLIMKLNLPVNKEEHPENLDYDKLASKIAEKTVFAQEKVKKEHYIALDGEIVRIETKGNSRIIYKSENNRPTGQRLR
ncbi:hypothetical protein CHRYSEOSP005_14970 [Chryseobacterium sp. Alg-005]|uniref:tape measure protein n=1 Tax=Chryseobacterium sp. Alg-005 TaxID=3159516 RepID=UPI003555ABB6